MKLFFAGFLFYFSLVSNAKTSEGNNVLNRAIVLNDSSAVEQTLHLRIDVNSPDPQGNYAIHLAAGGKIKDKILEMLLKKGANPNIQDYRKQTPLQIAIRAHSAAKVKMLLNAGADPRILNYMGDNALVIAVADRGNDPAEITRLILDSKKINVNETDHTGYTPLMLATLRMSPSLETVKILLKQGADKSIRIFDKYTALDFAEGMYDLFKSQGVQRNHELKALAEIKNLLNQ